MANGNVILRDGRLRGREVFRGVRKLRQGATREDVYVKVWGGLWRVQFHDDLHAWVGDYITDLISAGMGAAPLSERMYEYHVRRIPHVRRMRRGLRYASLWRRKFMRAHPEYVDLDYAYGFSFVDDPRWFRPDPENTLEEQRRWLRALETVARYGVLEPQQHVINVYEPREVRSTNEHGIVISETRNLLSLHVDKPAWGVGVNMTPYTEAERAMYESA